MQHDEGLPSDSYRLIRRLKPASTGDVFEATHPRLPGRYAIKILNRAILAKPDAINQYQAELDNTMGLRHPNIAQQVELSRMPDGTPFLVMEYLDGQELEERMAETGPLPVAEVAAVIKGVAAGLYAAHGRKVVHREVNPRSVFLAAVEGHDSGFPKLLNFGTWQLRAAVGLGGAMPTLAGSRYQAPEQVQGRGEIDHRADQFALAAIAYRMLSGVEPFNGEDSKAIRHEIVSNMPLPLSARIRCEPAMDAVLRRGLAKDKGERFENIVEFARAFEKAAQAEAVRRTAPRGIARVPEVGTEDPTLLRDRAEPRQGMDDVSPLDELQPADDDDDYDLEVPRNRWKAPVFVVGALVACIGTMLLVGWRPPLAWRQSQIWHALHLPMAAAPAGVEAARAAPAPSAAVPPSAPTVTPLPVAAPAAAAAPAVAEAAPVAPGAAPTPAAAPSPAAEAPAPAAGAPVPAAVPAPAAAAPVPAPTVAAGAGPAAEPAPKAAAATGERVAEPATAPAAAKGPVATDEAGGAPARKPPRPRVNRDRPAPLRGYIWSEREQRLVPSTGAATQPGVAPPPP